MRPGHVLFSAVQLLITAVLLCVGGFFFFLPWAPHMRLQLISLFSEREDLFILIGSGFLGLGLILLIGFYFMNRHSYYQLEMKDDKHTAAVEILLLRKSVELYWKRLFPDKDLSTDVLLHHGQKIEVIVELPSMSQEEEQLLLEKAEKEIGALLTNQIGYFKEFLFTVLT